MANQIGSTGTAGEITIYPGSATGNFSPGANTIAGSVTNLLDPAGIAVDSTNKIFVANEGGASGIGSVTTYAPGSAGNVAPLQTIAGPATGLMISSGIAVNPGNGNIFVSNLSGSITVFAATANGNATPIRTISGTNTQLSGPFGIAVGNNKIFVANSGSSAVTVYPVGANGNVAPSQVISGPATGISGGAFGVAWPSKTERSTLRPAQTTSPSSRTEPTATSHRRRASAARSRCSTARWASAWRAAAESGSRTFPARTA